LCAQDADERIYVVDEYAEAGLTPSAHADNIKAMLSRHHLHPTDLDTIVAGRDCFARREDGHTIAEKYQDNGLDFVPAEEDRVSGWQRMFDGFGDAAAGRSPTLFIHKSCTHCIAQIKMAQHSEKVQGDIQKFNYAPSDAEGDSASFSEGDDCLDALRKAVLSNTSGGMKMCLPFSTTSFQPAMIELPCAF
jgi:hypothetical protein